MAPAVAALPQPAPAKDIEVAWEQFAYVMDHVAEAPPQCGCSLCGRFLAIRAILFQIFDNLSRTNNERQ
jgi:hypothetical protein